MAAPTTRRSWSALRWPSASRITWGSCRWTRRVPPISKSPPDVPCTCRALDAEGRLVQSMRTFVQAAPGTTRSCIGCHEQKYNTATNAGLRDIVGRAPDRLQPESWGSGYVDYPSMVQPLLDKHCVSCHGGEKDIAAGMDLSGGWTEHFNISYGKPR